MNVTTTVNWSELDRWDFKYARIIDFDKNHPNYLYMYEIAEEAHESVDPREYPDKEWPVYGVSNRDGVFLNERRLGGDFNQKQKKIKKDWFFHNPTRANVGSIGRVHDVCDDAITSPEYQVWKIKKGALYNADLVEILVKSRMFIEQVQFHRVGAVKERLYVENLLSIRVPIITEEVRHELIGRIRDAKSKLEMARINLSKEAANASRCFDEADEGEQIQRRSVKRTASTSRGARTVRREPDPI